MSRRWVAALVVGVLSGSGLGCRERDISQSPPPAVEIPPRDAGGSTMPAVDAARADTTADRSGPADRTGEDGAVASGLVLHLPLDESSGATRAVDLSGQGNDGLLVGPPPSIAGTPGRKGGALTLGGGTHLRVASSVSLNGIFRGFTASAFVQLSGTPAGRSAVLARQGGYAFGLVAGRPYLALSVQGATGANAIEVAASAPAPVGPWVHLAGVFDPAGVARVYLDGKEVAALPVTGTIANSMVPLTVGARLQGDAVVEPFTGALDEVRLHNRALTAAEVSRLATDP